MKLMIVEDEPGLQLGLRDLFEEAGYAVDLYAEGKPALAQLAGQTPDAVILDLGLPDIDGTLVLEQLNGNYPQLPVLVLTSRANESDIVLGFKMGAFDYVTKPFSPRVLLARVESLLKRSAGSADLIKLGPVTVDATLYQATKDGEPLHLSTREIDLIRFLALHGGKPVSRNDILDEVWGMESEAGPRTVDTHIALLRKKIEANPDRPGYLLSQRGIGYKLIRD